MSIVFLLTDFETSNAADDCYKLFEFLSGELQHCYNYSIVNDQNCQLEKQFKISLSLLSSNDIKIRLDPRSSTTTIVIDDRRDKECCKLSFRLITSHVLSMYPVVRVGFEETSLTVSENQESVEICVNSTSPGIEENFTVNITPDNEGMLYSVLFFIVTLFLQVFFKVFISLKLWLIQAVCLIFSVTTNLMTSDLVTYAATSQNAMILT